MVLLPRSFLTCTMNMDDYYLLGYWRGCAREVRHNARVRLVGLVGTSFGAMQPDFSLQIAHSDITAEDVLQLSQALNLTDNAPIVLSYFGA